MSGTQIAVIVMLVVACLNASLNIASRHDNKTAWATPLALLLAWGWYAAIALLLGNGGFWS